MVTSAPVLAGGATLASGTVLVGRLIQAGEHRLSLADEKERRFEVPTVAIRDLAVSAGRGSKAASGLKKGAVIGTALYMVALRLSCSSNKSGCPAGDYVKAGGLGLFLGATMGGVIGSMRGTDRWVPVRLDAAAPSARERFSGAPPAMALRFTIRF
ncbi:MAG TPA: hypothetical protein VFO85_06135 [Vicinamibacteria bacterium]|nr:hypothetical protein [Vicinamibacteria bacterium]